MATIAEQLTSLANTKTAIKDAIVAKGVAVADTDPFSAYAIKIGEIQAGGGGEVVNKVKYGVTIDNILGDVDSNGNYVVPSEPLEVNLGGVKNVPARSFYYKFYNIKKLTVNANDITSVGTYCFSCAFATETASNTDFLSISFDGLETAEGEGAFYQACKGRSPTQGTTHISFKKLKKVNARQCFSEFASSLNLELFGQIFPSLEEIQGNDAFYAAFKVNKDGVYNFQTIKKIVGASAAYSATFGGIYVQNTVWNFPNATEFTGYIWNGSSSYASEIHFAAANQAAIEACNGYANKWGFLGATIYFDL